MAPADHANATRVYVPITLQHPASSGLDVLGFQTAVINLMPVIRAVTAATAIIRSDHSIALFHQLAHHMGFFVRGDIAVNLAMSENNQGQLPCGSGLLREESHG